MFKKSWSQYKLSLIAVSAGVLLLTVGVIYVVWVMPPSPKVVEEVIPLPA